MSPYQPQTEPLPWYQWHPKDFRASRQVQRMTYVERGLYRELLDENYLRGFVPDDISELADICSVPVDVMQEAWKRLSRCFYETEPGKLSNDRMDCVLTKQQRTRATNSENGKRSAEARAKTAHDPPPATAERVERLSTTAERSLESSTIRVDKSREDIKNLVEDSFDQAGTLDRGCLDPQGLALAGNPVCYHDSTATPLKTCATQSTPPPAPAGSDVLTRAIEIWNRNCGDTLRKTRAETVKRRAKLKTRIGEVRDRETYFAELERAVKLCAATPFLLGQNDRHWSADFDWLIKNDENLGKVLDGKYGAPSAATSTTRPVYYANPFDRPEYADDLVAGGQA